MSVDEAGKDDCIAEVDALAGGRVSSEPSAADGRDPATLDPQPAIFDCPPDDRHDPSGPEIERFGPAHDFAAAGTRLGWSSTAPVDPQPVGPHGAAAAGSAAGRGPSASSSNSS